MVPTLFGVSLLLCALTCLAPGNATTADEAATLTHEQHAAASAWNDARFGYDQPFMRRYGMWVMRVIVPEEGEHAIPLGRSTLSGRSVWEELRWRLPVTMALSAYSLLIAMLVAMPAGLVMALRAGRKADRIIGGALLTVWSVPMVVMATFLLGFLARGGNGVAWFPAGGLRSETGATGTLDVLWHLTLPALSLAIVACAPLARQIRAALLEQLGQEFVQTALAKGLPTRTVIRSHVLRAGLVPIVTVLATLVPGLIAGSVLIERIFSIDGMGMLAWRSAVNRDFDVVLAIAMLTAIAHMLALLAADVVTMLLDPRVRMAVRS